MKILWKKQIKTNNACFVCFLEEKKINGARKEIFLNEKKKQFCMMLNYKSAPKQTHKMMIYIYTPSIFTTTKNQTISRNF